MNFSTNEKVLLAVANWNWIAAEKAAKEGRRKDAARHERNAILCEHVVEYMRESA